jgi:hypothetical protein
MVAKKHLLISVIVILLLTSSACQASQDFPQNSSDNPLVGTWIQSSNIEDFYFQVNADGTFAVAPLYNDLEKFPIMSGMYSFEDDVLTLNVTQDPPIHQECTGETAQFKVNFVQNDEFYLEDVEWECNAFNYLSSENHPFSKYSETEG